MLLVTDRPILGSTQTFRRNTLTLLLLCESSHDFVYFFDVLRCGSLSSYTVVCRWAQLNLSNAAARDCQVRGPDLLFDSTSLRMTFQSVNFPHFFLSFVLFFGAMHQGWSYHNTPGAIPGPLQPDNTTSCSPPELIGTCNKSCANAKWEAYGSSDGPICGVPGCT